MRQKITDDLMQSYRADEAPFITGQKIAFRQRKDSYEEVNLFREIFFPKYWNSDEISEDAGLLEKKISDLEAILRIGVKSTGKPDILAYRLLLKLPEIREKLKMDAEAAYKHDPAAKSYVEIIRSYPGFQAMLVHRVAHELYGLGVFDYARELNEHAHTITGIDIHPGSRIGNYFFIDHGTGVVIGETAEIGDWVTIYQEVTLGVLHFQKGEDGVLQKGYKRHPTIGNHVVIGAGAKILGPVTVGDNASIGTMSRIEEDIPSNTSVFPTKTRHHKREKRG